MEITKRTTDNQYVVFKLGEEYYGVDIYKVKIIERISDFTRVPNAPEYVTGVMNLRGDVVTVIDLRKRLNYESFEISNDSRIIIVTVNEMEVGLIVDSSSEVLQLDNEVVDKPPTIGENISDDFVSGIGKKDGRLIILLDLEKVLNIKEKK